MGANSTQAGGVTVFLLAFVLLAYGLADGGILFELIGAVLLAAAAGLFLKCKPWEHTE
jgi:hypothetical protein